MKIEKWRAFLKVVAGREEKCKYLNEAIRVMETRELVSEIEWEREESAQRREKANKRANKSTREAKKDQER